jgi:surface carbohydrate biosynthesis protein
MNIYFHIDELKRDAVAASALKKKFAKKEHKLVYGNRVSNRLLKYFHSAFDVIVVPRPHILYDNWGEEWMSWNIRFVILSSESLGVICKDHYVMARTLLEKEYFEGQKQYINRIDAFCLWGSKQLQALKDYAPEIEHKCHVVGHPRHDLCCIDTKASKYVDKKKIGIIARAVGLNDYFGRPALIAFETLFDDHHQYEFLNKKNGEKLKSRRPGAQPLNTLISQAIDAENTLKVIRSLEELGYDITFRPHPKENIQTWTYVFNKSGLKTKVSDVADQPISTWLKDVKYIIGPPSTSFYDALMLGVTPISLSSIDSRRENCIDELWEDNNHLMPYIYKPESINELIEIIECDKHLYDNNDVLSVLKEEADFPGCADSLNKFVSICIDNKNVSENKMDNSRLAFFESGRILFNSVWKIKNIMLKRAETSASFAMDRKKKRFIDKLTTVDC